jgi:ElaB/YqjD/DUF883 family membrane-anchored ribosome-binding protein
MERYEEYPGTQANQANNDVVGATQEELGRMSQRLGQAYNKTADAVRSAYGKTERYATEHPGTFALIAFGAGIGLGLALAGSLPRRRHRVVRRSRRMALPIVDAMADCARAYLR